MPILISQISDILKNQYLGPIREQLNNDIVLLKRLEKDSESVVGQNFTIPLHVARNEGIGAIADGGNLPTAGAQGYKQAIVPMRYLYGRIEIGGPAMKATRNSEGAFVRLLEAEMKGIARDLKSDVNRQLFGDGTGILATCGTTAGATTVVVASTAKLRVGMIVDIVKKADGTTGTGATGRVITAISSATAFVISGAAITTDNTYCVYRSGSRNLEMMGLGGIVADTDPAGGALQGLAVASNPIWKANILANGGTPRAITETLMQQAMDITEQAGAGKTTALFTTFGVRRAYMALLKTNQQFVNETEFDGGFKALSYNGLPLIPDKDCPAKSVYFIDENSLKFYELADWDWMDEDGAVLSRVSGKDAYEATMYKYAELGCSARNANTLLTDLVEA